MLFGEGQLRGQVLPHHVTVEQRHRTTASLQQFGHHRVGDGGFARARETGEKQGEALLIPWRMGLAQLLHHVGIGEPFVDLQPLTQATAQFSAGNVQLGLVLAHLVDGHVLGALLHVNHGLERYHFDTDLVGVLGHHLLRIVWAVEILALRVLARSGVVTADDEVGTAMVTPDQSVPQRFTWASHPHGQVQQRHGRGLIGVVPHDRLVAAHAGKVVNVARLGHADNWMDQQVCFSQLRGANRQFDVRAMERVPGLESHHLAPAPLVKHAPQVVRGVTVLSVVVVHRLIDACHCAAEVYRTGLVVQVAHSRVRLVVGAVHHFGFAMLVGAVHFLDVDHSQRHAFLIP